MNRRPQVLFLALLVICLIDRMLLVTGFGVHFTSADDAVFWAVADDMAHGRFREPFLYGQDYNPPLESWIAAPLLRIGLPIPLAMPVAVSLLALAPFLTWAWWHARRREWLAASIFLVMPMLLPVQWGMITTMSRGFVNGLGLIALLPAALLIRRLEWRFAAAGLIAALAMAVNPNALLFVLPFLAAQWLESDRRWGAVAWFLLGALPGAAFGWAAARFYQLHPERVVHRLGEDAFGWDLDRLVSAFATLDARFAGLCPLWWPNGHVILWLIALTGVVLWRTGHRPAGFALLLSLVLVAASFGMKKAADGTAHVFHPLARMYLALPLVLAWGLARIACPPRLVRLLPMLALIAGTAALGWKMMHARSVIDRELASTIPTPVAPVSVHRLKADARRAVRFAKEHRVELLVTMFGEEAQPFMALNYAGPILEPDMPRTLFLGHDRRFWRRWEERDAVRERVLFIGADEGYWAQPMEGVPPMELMAFGSARARLLTGNALTTGELLRRLKWDLGPMP